MEEENIHTVMTPIAPPSGMGMNIKPEIPALKWCPTVKTIGYAVNSK